MVHHISEISGLFGVKCLNCDTIIILLTKYSAWNKDDIEVVINSHVYWDTLYLNAWDTKHVLCPNLRFYVNKLKTTFDKKSVLLEMNIF